LDLTKYLQSFVDIDSDREHCILCKAEFSEYDAYQETRHREATANGTLLLVDCWPFCSGLCLSEGMARNLRPCDACDTTGIHTFTYRTYDGYETEGVECPCCPNERGYFIDDEPTYTLSDYTRDEYGYRI
jgi:hypothetical protein